MAKSKNVPLDELPVISEADRPDTSLGFEPVIETEDQANEALQEMAYLDAYARSVQARAACKMKRIQDAANAMCVLKVGNRKVPCGDRSQALGAALKVYAQTHRPELKEADGKRIARSVKLTHGKIGWAKGRDAVVVSKGCTAKDVKQALESISATDDKPGVITRLQNLLSRMRMFGADPAPVKADLIFTVSVDLSTTKAREAVGKKKITQEQLAQLNLEFRVGTDEFFAEPATFQPTRAAVP